MAPFPLHSQFFLKLSEFSILCSLEFCDLLVQLSSLFVKSVEDFYVGVASIIRRWQRSRRSAFNLPIYLSRISIHLVQFDFPYRVVFLLLLGRSTRGEASPWKVYWYGSHGCSSVQQSLSEKRPRQVEAHNGCNFSLTFMGVCAV